MLLPKGYINHIYVLVLSLLLFLSFTPTESESGNISLYLRIFPYVLFLILSIVSNLSIVRVDVRFLLSLVFCSIVILLKINDFGFRLVLQLIAVILTIIFVSSLEKSEVQFQYFLKAITIVITVWLTFLFGQIIFYQIFGFYFDFHKMFLIISESRGGINASHVRFGGVQIEPGTYSNWMYGLVLVRVFLIKRISTPLHWFAIISTLLTLSFWAYISFVFFFVSALLENKGVNYLKIFIIVFFACLCIYFLFGDDLLSYLEARVKFDTGTATSKIDVYDYIYHNFSTWILSGESFSSVPCNGCLSPQDSGVGINLLFYFGILLLFLIVLLFLKSYTLMGPQGFILLLPILFSKFFYWDPITVLIFTFILSKSRS